MKLFLTSYSYYFILTLFFVWILSLVLAAYGRGQQIKAFLISHKYGLLLTLLLSCVIFASVPVQYRVLSDETNLLSVAKSMTFEKNINNVTEGKWYYGTFWPSNSSIEKRPFLFPFLVHLAHQALGYRTENVFILNFFVLWGLLFLIFAMIRNYLNSAWAFAGVLLTAAQPMVALCATSGNVEVLNALFLGLSFVALQWFLRTTSKESFTVLILTLLMLCHIRYESFLFLAITLIFLILGKYIRLELFSRNIALLIAPIFLIPLILQRIIMAGVKDSNLHNGSWLSAFHINNIAYNIPTCFSYIFDVSGSLGYAGLINWVGTLALIYFALAILSNKIKIHDHNRQFLFAIPLASLLVWFLIVISYQGGINDHPINGRIYLPLLIIMSVLPIGLMSKLIKEKERGGTQVLLIATVLFLFYHPIAMEDRVSHKLTILREDRFVKDFLHKINNKDILVICGRPGQLIVENYGAISFRTANKDKNTLKKQYQNHLFSDIYVIQSVSYSTNQPFKDQTLDPSYELEKISSLQMSGSYFLQISRLKK